jgi:RNA polymerase sigma factor (sigma-70 family)
MDTKALVHIVEDDQMLGRALVRLLGSVGIDAKAYVSPFDFLHEFDGRNPGCVLIDLRLPGMSGLELQEKLTERRCGHPVIFLTAHGDVATAVRAMKAGAMDFIQKPYSEQGLLDAVSKAINHHLRHLAAEQESESVRVRMQQLSPREREVLRLVVAGKPTKQIAAELGLSHKTVDNHRASILEKMGATGVVELVRLILIAQPGFIREEPPVDPSRMMSRAS